MAFSLNRRLIRTLFDIGLLRLQRRFRYSLRQVLDRNLPPGLVTAWAAGSAPPPKWLFVLRSLEVVNLQLPDPRDLGPVSFDFLQQKKELSWPICWNDPNWSRLWQFHLHYFDWARHWLELALVNGHWPNQAAALVPLIDHWVNSNVPGRDG